MSDRVLYVDDRFELPERVDEILGQAGFELVHTSDPREALRLVQEDQPALVLVEVLHPEYDGFELIRELDSRAPEPPLPIVVLTRGERTPQLYGQAIELGVEDFVCKPVVEAEVLEAVLAFASKRGVDAEEAEPTSPAMRPFDGSLVDQPLPQLLGRLFETGSSGVLSLQRGSDTRAVELRNGSPVEVLRHRNVESVADYLRRTQRIDAAQHEMLVDQLMARIAGPREILLGMGALTEVQLASANRDQAREVLLEMFDWGSGQFRFQPGERLPAGETLEVASNPTRIILSGLRKTPGDVIHGVLSRRSALYVTYSHSKASRLEEMGLPPAEHAAVESLDGDRTLAEVSSSAIQDEKTLYALYALCIVQLDESPMLVLDQELKPDEPDPFVTLPPQSNPVEKPRRRKRVPPPAPEPGTIEARIEGVAERLDSGDDFELFGIDESSGDSDVRAAYRKLLDGLDTTGLPKELEEPRERARTLRARLDQAYQRVRTADNRQAFAGLRTARIRKQPVNEDRREREEGTRAVDAETWFRMGEGHMSHDKFGEAVEAFGMAVHLDPDQGDYAAHLGYALYCATPNDEIIRREALEHVAKGVKLAPDREKPLLFLSRIFRETGDAASAAKVVRRALRANPDSPALVQEMCLIETGDKKSRFAQLQERLRRAR